MKILLISHPNALQSDKNLKPWIDAFCTELLEFDVRAKYFDSLRDKILEFNAVHFFSFEDFETYRMVRKFDLPIVVTPPHTSCFLRKPLILRVLRSLIQRKKNPLDLWSGILSPDAYSCFDETSVKALSEQCGVPGEKIFSLPKDVKKAARFSSSLYSHIVFKGKH